MNPTSVGRALLGLAPVCLFSIVASAQNGELAQTNTAGLQPFVFSGHDVGGIPMDANSMEISQAAIERARAAMPAARLLTQPQKTNLGEIALIDFQGHDLTDVSGADGPLDRILYAPSEGDDVAWRAALAAAAGGATVDYFDARVATPDVALMSSYDAVYTWANAAYSNNLLFGDNLAAYSDLGGHVVMGVFCTYTSGNFLSGLIMTPAYCPVVSPAGTNHFSSDFYAGDGTTCLYNGVSSLECFYRDFLVTQGTGVVDGTYLDGEICHAFRPNPGFGGEVVYSNGAGASPILGTGEWDFAVANSALCNVGGVAGPTFLYAPTEADDAAFRTLMSNYAGGAQVDYFDARAATPTLAFLQQYEFVYTWANFAYFDNVAMGDVLADYCDLGGNVVLGAFCTYTSGNFLAGRIMTPQYSPVVSPTGTNHFSTSSYAFDGVTCVYDNVATLDCFYRDFLVTQGGGKVDGTYQDGEICHAIQTFEPFPGAGDVVYSNGAGAYPLSGNGEWAEAVVNSGTCIGTQFIRNSVLPPFNAVAWLPDPLGPPSISRGIWMPLFDGTPAPWAPPLSPVAVAYTALFTGPAIPDILSPFGGPNPWILGDITPPNPLALQGPVPVLPVLVPTPWAIPPQPALVGVSFATQAVVIDFGGIPIRFTNALDINVGT